MLIRRIMVSATVAMLVAFAVLGCSDNVVSTDADLKIVSRGVMTQEACISS